jgi:hypothetical protein
MKFILQAVSLIAGFTLAATAFADVEKDNIGLELSFIKRIFQTGYAPAEWKKQQFGWDLNTEYQKAQSALVNKTTVDAASYRNIIAGLLTSTHDYHVGFSFYATEAATLPFNVFGVNGKYFVGAIDTAKLDKKAYPIQPGDELISWNGRPIADVMKDLIAQMSWGVPTTDARLAELTLTRRRASRTIEVPQGRVDLVFQRVEGSQSKSIGLQMTWEYTPESVQWNPESMRSEFSLLAQKPSQMSTGILRPQMAWGMWKEFSDVDIPQWQIGGRTSYVPVLGQVIWHSDDKDHFDSYIYRNDAGKLIGYVRIPHYVENGDAFREFKKVIARMQGATDGLVIDEINNPGGSVFYVLALMSVLSDKPIKVPDHQMTLWPSMLDELLKQKVKLAAVTNDEEARKAYGSDDIDGYPVNYQLAQSYMEFAREIETAWKNKVHLTAPMHLEGVDKVNPDPEVHYTKPIVVLVNELDFSGGDFFPAILQDNKRVKIFGQRTSGAGGYVLSVEFPSALGLQKFSFTGSIARRINNDPIENLGVTPDIPYALTERDLREGFVDYKDAINKAIQDQL